MIAIGAVTIWLTSIGFSDQYDDLVKKGYRWITSDGPFACRSKEDLQRIIKDPSDENTLLLVAAPPRCELAAHQRRLWAEYWHIFLTPHRLMLYTGSWRGGWAGFRQPHRDG